MNCPIDQQPLRGGALEPGLVSFDCPGCGGHWIRLADYAAWREQAGAAAPSAGGGEHDEPDQGEDAPAASGARATERIVVKRCPDCQHLLGRYRVGHGLPFAVDQCVHCHGIWLDGAEWEALRARGLHDDLQKVADSSWQRSVRAEEQRRTAEARLVRHFGAEDYERTKAFKAWLDAHPKRSELLAFLMQTE